MTDLHQQEEEQVSTPQAGSESDTDLEEVISELFPEDNEEKKEEFLAQINKIEGRNYKSIDDYAKTVKERQKAFSEQGRKEKEVKEVKDAPQKVSPVIKSLYFKANPEAQTVWDEVVEAAKDKDPFELYESSKYFQKEAQTRYAEAQEKDKNGKKVSKPSQKISGIAGEYEELSEADRAFLKRRGITEEEFRKRQVKQ